MSKLEFRDKLKKLSEKDSSISKKHDFLGKSYKVWKRAPFRYVNVSSYLSDDGICTKFEHPRRCQGNHESKSNINSICEMNTAYPLLHSTV